MSMNNVPWWYHLAVIGKSVGVGIGAFAGTAMTVSAFIPGYGPAISAAVGAIAGLATVVTHYANSGVNSVDNTGNTK